MVLITKMMKNRKDHFRSAVDDELFKKASNFHTEPVNEKVKAKFLAYLIKEYGRQREVLFNASISHRTRSKGSRKRSVSKPLSSKKHSPTAKYNINVYETSSPGDLKNDSIIGNKNLYVLC